MKKQTMKMTLALTTVLGAGSIPAGSFMLTSIGGSDQGAATASAEVDIVHRALQILVPSVTRAHEGGAAMGTTDMADMDMALTSANQASDLSPPAENMSQGVAAFGVSQAMGSVGATGMGAAFGGVGGVSRDSGGAAGAAPLLPVFQSPIAAPTPEPAANALPPSATGPESGPGTTPLEIAAVALPDPTTPDPGPRPYDYVLEDLPSLPPSQGENGSLDDPTPTTVAEGALIAPNNTVPEPSTLALLGIAVLGWAAHRRKQA